MHCLCKHDDHVPIPFTHNVIVMHLQQWSHLFVLEHLFVTFVYSEKNVFRIFHMELKITVYSSSENKLVSKLSLQPHVKLLQEVLALFHGDKRYSGKVLKCLKFGKDFLALASLNEPKSDANLTSSTCNPSSLLGFAIYSVLKHHLFIERTSFWNLL